MRNQPNTDALTWISSVADHVADVSKRSTTAGKRLITPVVIALVFVPGQAAAQTDQTCGDVPVQFQQLAELLTHIQQLGVALGLSIAAVMYVWAGILWMRGTPDSQQRARRIFFNTSVGLVLILIAGGLVKFVTSVLCGGA